MVKIENVNEFRRIKKSNFGYVLAEESNKAVFHKPTCNTITEENYIKSMKNNSQTRFHWFSAYSSAEKEFSSFDSCKVCNP